MKIVKTLVLLIVLVGALAMNNERKHKKIHKSEKTHNDGEGSYGKGFTVPGMNCAEKRDDLSNSSVKFCKKSKVKPQSLVKAAGDYKKGLVIENCKLEGTLKKIAKQSGENIVFPWYTFSTGQSGHDPWGRYKWNEFSVVPVPKGKQYYCRIYWPYATWSDYISSSQQTNFGNNCQANYERVYETIDSHGYEARKLAQDIASNKDVLDSAGQSKEETLAKYQKQIDDLSTKIDEETIIYKSDKEAENAINGKIAKLRSEISGLSEKVANSSLQYQILSKKIEELKSGDVNADSLKSEGEKIKSKLEDSVTNLSKLVPSHENSLNEGRAKTVESGNDELSGAVNSIVVGC